MRKRLALAVTVSLAAASTGLAEAAPGLYVIEVADGPETADAMRQAAAEVGGLVQQPLQLARSRLVAGAVHRDRLADFARSRALMAEGWRSYLAVRPEFAASRLAEARRLAVEVADLPGGALLVAEVSLRLGAVKLDLGRRTEAEDDFRLARRLAPEREVTDAEFKPEVVEVALAARDAAPPTGTLVFRGSVAQTEVAVDGGSFGSAPRSLTIESGLHLVVARATGHRSVAELVLVVAQQRGEVVVRPVEDPERRALTAALRVGAAEDSAAVFARALIAYGNLDGLYLAASVWRQGQPAALVQWCEYPARCSPVVEIRYREGGARAALSEGMRRARGNLRDLPPLLTVDARVTEPEARRAPGEVVDNSSLWSSPWLWVGVGAAATTVAVSAALVFGGGDDEQFPVVVGDVCDLGSC